MFYLLAYPWLGLVPHNIIIPSSFWSSSTSVTLYLYCCCTQSMEYWYLPFWLNVRSSSLFYFSWDVLYLDVGTVPKFLYFLAFSIVESHEISSLKQRVFALQRYRRFRLYNRTRLRARSRIGRDVFWRFLS